MIVVLIFLIALIALYIVVIKDSRLGKTFRAVYLSAIGILFAVMILLYLIVMMAYKPH